jgi:hypothetical protein
MTVQPASPAGSSVSARLLHAAAILFIAFVVISLYTFVHELGHALVGLAFGGRLTSFDVAFWNLNPHVGLNGNFSLGQRSLINLAGTALPLLLWMAFLALSPRRGEPLFEWFKLVGSLVVINSLLAWIVIPFLFMAGRPPADDSASFLMNSGAPPLLVAAVALGVYVYGWVLALHRTGGLAGLRERLHQTVVSTAGGARVGGSPRTLLGFGVALLGIVLASAAIQQFYPFTGALAAPQGYEPAFQADYVNGPPESHVLYSFTLPAASEVSLFFALEDVERGPARITLAGANGYQNTFLRAPADYQTAESTVHPQRIPLPPGDYWIEVELPASSARVSGYIRIEAEPSR